VEIKNDNFANCKKCNLKDERRIRKSFRQRYLNFLYENWWALHTDNPFWAVRDMQEICRQNGG
jgi:hypothetical protein